MRSHRLHSHLNRFSKEESGATAIEYSIVAAILAIAVAGTVGGIRDSLKETFNSVADELGDNN